MARIQNQYWNQEILTDEKKKMLLKKAAIEFEKLTDREFLVITSGKRKEASYDCYELYVKEEHFIHLVGYQTLRKKYNADRAAQKNQKEVSVPDNIKNSISARGFYKKCRDGLVDFSEVDCPHPNMTSAKLSVIADQIRFDSAVRLKYKAGKHNVTAQYNDFNWGMGNEAGLVGCKRNTQDNGYKNSCYLSTVLKGSIGDHCTGADKVVAVLTRTKGRYYDQVLCAPKNGLMTSDFPDTIRRKLPKDMEVIQVG